MPSFSSTVINLGLRLAKFNRLIGKELASGIASRQQPSMSLIKRHQIEHDIFEGHAVWKIKPQGGQIRSSKVFYHLHGGAYVMGLQAIHFRAYAKLADLTGAIVIAFDYPLPPETMAMETVALTIRHFEAVCDAYGVENVVIGGDSAGGGLAIVIIQALLKAGRPIPAKMILWAPLVDATLTNPEIASKTREYVIEPKSLIEAGIRYADGVDPADPIISPIHGSLKGLPSMWVFTGDEDILHPDIMLFAQKAKTENVDITVHTGHGLTHVYMYLPTPEASAALRQTADLVVK